MLIVQSDLGDFSDELLTSLMYGDTLIVKIDSDPFIASLLVCRMTVAHSLSPRIQIEEPNPIPVQSLKADLSIDPSETAAKIAPPLHFNSYNVIVDVAVQ